MSAAPKALRVDELDRFTQLRFSEVAARLSKVRQQHSDISLTLLGGMLGQEFADDELSLLGTTGLLSKLDELVMARHGRPLRPFPQEADA